MGADEKEELLRRLLKRIAIKESRRTPVPASLAVHVLSRRHLAAKG